MRARWLVIATCLLASRAPRAACDTDLALDSASSVPGSLFAQTLAVLGVGGGVMRVDLPDVNDPSRSFGTEPRVGFEVGAELRPWLELGADLGLTSLGESDSLNAILVQRGASGTSAVTHVQSGVFARVRWIPSARWAPWLRAGGGIAGLWTSAPLDLGGHEVDAAWNAGLGLDFFAHRRLLIRAEGLYLGQETDGGVASHSIATLSLLFAVGRSASE